MKKLLSIIGAVLLMSSAVFAQAPEKISYQAVVRNSNGDLINNQSIGMQVSVLQGSASGAVIYVETQMPTSNTSGLVSIEIGTGFVVSGTFLSIDWGSDSYFMKIETDLAGGTNYTLTSTSELLSVPYALHAKTAESVSGPITESQNLSDVIAEDNNANDQIKNVTDPTDSQDAATKTYVDNRTWNEMLFNDRSAHNSSIYEVGGMSMGTISNTPSAMLHMSSSTQGFLPPQMSEVQRDAIPSPAEGLQIYNTTTHEPNYYNGSIWMSFNGSAAEGLSIGDFYQGGIVFYVDGTGEHGLIVNMIDLSTNATWGCYGVDITGANGQGIGDGEQNTLEILSECSTTGIPARLCNEYRSHSYEGWFLPSTGEFTIIEANKTLINQALNNNNGDIISGAYWTSTEMEGGFTNGQRVYVSPSDDVSKNSTTYSTRAVRKF